MSLWPDAIFGGGREHGKGAWRLAAVLLAALSVMSGSTPPPSSDIAGEWARLQGCTIEAAAQYSVMASLVGSAPDSLRAAWNAYTRVALRRIAQMGRMGEALRERRLVRKDSVSPCPARR